MYCLNDASGIRQVAAGLRGHNGKVASLDDFPTEKPSRKVAFSLYQPFGGTLAHWLSNPASKHSIEIFLLILVPDLKGRFANEHGERRPGRVTKKSTANRPCETPVQSTGDGVTDAGQAGMREQSVLPKSANIAHRQLSRGGFLINKTRGRSQFPPHDQQ